MKTLIIVLLAGLIVGCSIPPFKPTAERRHIDLTIIVDDDLSWMGRDSSRYKVKGSSKCVGNKCTIWVPSIKSLDDENFRVWGKEAAHLYYEHYHGNIKDIY